MRRAILTWFCLSGLMVAPGGAHGQAPPYTQIRQGHGSTAWLLAPMAAVQASGVDLSARVVGRGNHHFDVTLFFNPAGDPEAGLVAGRYGVDFDGHRLDADPIAMPGDRRPYWVPTMQRGLITQLRLSDPSRSFEQPGNGDPADALAMLTGHRPIPVACTAADARRQVEEALALRKPVVYVTKQEGRRADLLMYPQPYAVVHAEGNQVTLYNPMNYPQCIRRLGGEKRLNWPLVRAEGDRFLIGETHFSRAEQVSQAFNLIQQAGSSTCWILSAMAALQYQGVNLNAKVQPLGENRYRILLHNYNDPANRDAGTYPRRVIVEFNGKTIGEDPVVRPNQKRAYWVVALHRGVIEAVHQWDPTQTIEKTHGGSSTDAFGILTGRRGPGYSARDADIRQKVEAALKRRAAIVYGSGGHAVAALESSGDDLILHDPYGSTGPVPWKTVMEKDGSFEILETRVMKKAANLLHNGSFEQGPDVGDFQPLDPGSTAIPGWTVTRGQIDDIADAWSAADGYHSLDLHGSPGFGGIQQTFPTVKGRRYRVTFALAGSPEAEVRRKRIGIGAAGQSGEFAFDSTGKSATKMGWVVKEWEFVAKDAQTTLEIYTLEDTDGLHGPALDDVRVQAVPGPSLLVNGSFEDGPDLSSWQHLDEGAGSMPGWKVTRGEVSLGGWLAEDGNRSLFFPGSSPHGALEQTFPTVKGRRYRLIFRLSANPNNGWWGPGSSTTSLRVSVAGQTREFPFDAAGKSPYNMGWTVQTWDFEAAGDRTTLEFSTPETDRGYWIGPALDRVRVMPLHDARAGGHP